MTHCTVSQIIRIIDNIAPPALSEKWDNSGLQVGDLNWPVQKIMTALDPLPEVVSHACENNVDLLITHHPLIISPVKKLDMGSSYGKIVSACIKNKLTIYCAHTNLDSAQGGLNDLLAEKIGLVDTRVLGEKVYAELLKLVVFVPSGSESVILDQIGRTGAGQIGAYTCCTFRNTGIGTYIPGESSTPYKGVAGELSHAEEMRIETIVARKEVDAVVERIRSVHPYETMAYDLYPLISENEPQGIGRVGRLPKPVQFTEFAKDIKKKLGLDTVKIAGKLDLTVNKVALCTGSGSSMLKAFMASGADIYVSGDLKYHDAVDLSGKGVGLLDIGHFSSEHIIVPELARVMEKKIKDKGLAASVQACNIEKDPFSII